MHAAEKDEQKAVKARFDPEIYKKASPVVLTSERFWDGGVDPAAPLAEKSEFYALAKVMSETLKIFLSDTGEDFYVADFLCENGSLYASWADLSDFPIFRAVSGIFKKKKCYRLSPKDDLDLIDLMVESNFGYYSHFSFFLPESGIITEPTCHTEIYFYSEKDRQINRRLADIIKNYPDLLIK